MKQLKASDFALLLMRLVVGSFAVYYGAIMVFGVIGSSGGFQRTIQTMGQQGITEPLAMTAMIGEFAGGIALIIGLITPIASLGVLAGMGCAAFLEFSRPNAAQAFIEGRLQDIPAMGFPLMVGLTALSLALMGPGKFSLDAKLFKKAKKA